MECRIVGLFHLPWLVTESEVRKMLATYNRDIAVRQLETELDSCLRYLFLRLGSVLQGWAKKPWARRRGWSLWFSGHKV